MKKNNTSKTATELDLDRIRKERRKRRRARREEWFNAKVFNLIKQLRKTREENIKLLEARREKG